MSEDGIFGEDKKVWLKWCVFVGFMGTGLLVGSILSFLTLKLNPQVGQNYLDVILLFLYVTLFYGTAGVLGGVVLGLILLKSAFSGSIILQKLTGAVLVAFLLFGPFSWAVSTLHTSRALYTLKGKILHAGGLVTPFLVILVCFMFVGAGYFIVGPLSKIKRPIKVVFVSYLLCFLLIFFTARGPGDSVQQDRSAAQDVDYSIRGSGLKFVILGLDCLDWDMLTPLMEEGKLPALSRMAEEGAAARFKALIPTLSPSLWTSIATGVDSDKHGIDNFYVTSLPYLSVPIRLFPGGFGLNFRIVPLLNNTGLVPQLIRMNTSNMKKVLDIWDIFSRFGRTVGVIDYFVTWPADEVNGFVLSDLLMRYIYEFGPDGINASEGLIYPLSIGSDVRKSLAGINRDDFDLGSIMGKLVSPDCDLTENNPYVKLLKRKFWRDECLWKLSTDLYAENRPDLMISYTSAIDGTNHVFKKFIYEPSDGSSEWSCFHTTQENWYRYEDSRIQQMMDLADDSTCIIVLSDHGWDEQKGHHENGPDGAILLWGAGVRRGVWFEETGLLDVVPTILAMSGLPVGKDMGGRVLVEAISEVLLDSFPIRYITSYTESDLSEQMPIEMDPLLDKQIREDLEALGYIK